jgi:beta-mannanase
LQKQVGRGVSVISTYVTVGRPVDPAVISLARTRNAKLLVTLMVDNGRDGPNQPSYALARVAAGRFDGKIRTLSRQLKAAKVPIILRPLPEPNTQWWAWAGTVNGNAPQTYIQAWNRVRTVVKRNAGKRVKLLWAPYARSIPDTDENAIDQYFPGNDRVDLVGVSGYNFGVTGELEWLDPIDLFQDPYIAIENLSTKPFWIAETGTTARGGSKTKWLRSLAVLQKSMPKLRGVVLYDVREGAGDFRIAASKPQRAATKAILATRCGKKR